MLRMYTIHDAKAGAYLTPFFLPNDSMAQRAFANCIQSDDHQFSKTPHDFTLFYIGNYHEDTAELDYTYKEAIGNGLDFLHGRDDTVAVEILKEEQE